jgi:hypothetical protein
VEGYTMTEEELSALKKEVASKKRIATEWSSQIHDLVEDRLFSDFHTLTSLAEKTVAACLEWQEAKAKYEQASG